MPNTENRPPIADIVAGSELKRWYWRKDELVAHARALRVPYGGGKFLLLDRLAHFLDTGEKRLPDENAPRPSSAFDWHKSQLSRETVITDSYRNSQNVRRFFKSELGDGFKFNIEFMAWMKGHVGATLGDACEEYLAMRARMANPGFQSEIADHNQFNQYTRDFMADNPELGMADVRRIWALKIKLPSETGRHVYERSDLDLKA